jgi:hypothetical protein
VRKQIDFNAVPRRTVLLVTCGAAIFSVAVFTVLVVFQGDSVREAAVRTWPLVSITLMLVYGAAMARRFPPR